LTFEAEIWLADAEAAWHFVTLPADLADEVRARTAGRRPFNSVPVRATVGSTSWQTSIFADRKSGSYLLPVKAEVRDREDVRAGDRVSVTLALRD
jgi:hypothetical protein